MSSILKVDTIQDQDGNNIINESANVITIGASGDNITIPSGATFASVGIDDNATSTAITIDSSENVGIGTSSPVSDARLTVSSDNSESYIFFERSGSTRFDSAIGMTSSNMVFKGGVNSSTVSGLNEFMRIDDSGNVGIGTTNTNTKLNVVGTGVNGINLGQQSDNSANSSRLFFNNSTNIWTAYSTTGNFKIASGATIGTSSGTDRLVIDSSGNVGIGTSSPSYELQVQDTGGSCFIAITSNNTNESTLLLGDSDSASIGRVTYRNSDNSLAFNTNGSEAMRIDSSGNVGLGTTSPSTSLHISQSQPIITLTDTDDNVSHQLSGQSSSRHCNLKVDTGGSSGSPVFNLSMQDSIKLSVLNSGNVGIGTTSPSEKLHVVGDILATGGDFKSDANNYLGFSNDTFARFVINDSEKMRITSSGNVGIGTTSPSSYYANHLVVDIGSTAQSGITIVADSSNQAMLAFADGTSGDTRYRGYLDYNHSNDSLAFASAGTERMRIDSSGRLAINTSSPDAGSIVSVNHEGSSTYGLSLNSTTTSGTQYHLRFARGGTQAGYITSNSATTIAVNNASDERLKENIQNSNSAIQDIKDMQVRQFDWVDAIDTHRDFGFVAQELVNVVPEAVTQGTDELDDNGKPVRTWGVDYSHIVPRLVKVCQEQQTKIEELEARITTLENA